MAQAHTSVSTVRSRMAALEARAHLGLLKVRIVIPLVFVAVISALLASQGDVHLERIFILALSGGLASAGAACLNHYLDRDIDVVMPRTRGRPIPSGEIRNPATAAFFGLGLIGVALAFASTLNLLSLAFIGLGAFFYVFIYTLWLKRSSPLSVVVGGFSGSCAALAGWAAIEPTISVVPAIIALLVFLWTPSHFWTLAIVLKEEYRVARVPMLPVLIGEKTTAWIVLGNTCVTVLASLLPLYLGLFGLIYLAVALIAGFLVLRGNLRLVLDPIKSVAWQNYRFSGIYLGLILMGMLVDVLV